MGMVTLFLNYFGARGRPSIQFNFDISHLIVQQIELALQAHVLLLESIDCDLVVAIDGRILSQHVLLFLRLQLVDLRLVLIGLLLKIELVVLGHSLSCQHFIIVVGPTRRACLAPRSQVINREL